MVAMTPLITIQIMGLVYKYKLSRTEEEERSEMGDPEGMPDYTDWERFESEEENYVPQTLLPEVDVEYVAGPEWLRMAYEEKLHDVIDDNEYIDLDDGEENA
jgi:hypothetical protein